MSEQNFVGTFLFYAIKTIYKTPVDPKLPSHVY